ncbi:MAG: SpoIIE family protein phosphatase [bacterium]|nr:SpoIIE family protein phosphatase [bacterium]
MLEKISIYIVPPFLTFLIGIYLSVISVLRGKCKAENVLFSLICIWWVLLGYVFISQQITNGASEEILIDQYIVQFIFAYVPVLYLLFFHTVLDIKRNGIVAIAVVTSFIFSLVVAFDYFYSTGHYIAGAYQYGWGCIIKGGIAFNIFGAYGALVIAYLVVVSFRRQQVETNREFRLKIRYILFSILCVGVLGLLNMLSIAGINFYPAGNFNFIPLSILGYGLLKHRLMDVRSMLHMSLTWVILSSLIIIPNIAIYYFFRDYISVLSSFSLFLFLMLWFLLNHLYFLKIQPVINRFFNKTKHNLREIETKFIEDSAFLKNLDELIDEFKGVLKKTLSLKYVSLYIRSGDSNTYINRGEIAFIIDPGLRDWFLDHDDFLEKNAVETNPYYDTIRERLQEIFYKFSCTYIVPLVRNNELIGLLFLPGKSNYEHFTTDEIRFVSRIRNAASIALANSSMYQNISNLKDNLEKIVEERTQALQTKNKMMLYDLRIAKNVQTALLPPKSINSKHFKIFAETEPLQEVSGDFYDIIKLPNNKVAVVIVDVSGHGVPSGLLTTIIQAEIEKQLIQALHPSTTCTIINSRLDPILTATGFYFTMLMAVFDLTTMTMEFTNCGHLRPIFLSPEGECKELAVDGLLIGAEPYFDFTYEELAFNRFDRIILCTDGITEAKNYRGSFYGTSSLLDLVKSTGHLSPEGQLREMLKRVNEFQSNTVKTDDKTIIVIEIGETLSSGDGNVEIEVRGVELI